MIVLDCFVAGRPRPKGSMDPTKSGYLKPNNKHVEEWQATVANACRREVATLPGRPGRWVMQDGYPILSPVSVTLAFMFKRPAKPKFEVPATTGTGDLDKLTRCIFDALTVAQVYGDDAQVCFSMQTATWVLDTLAEGVHIRVATL